MNAFQNSLEIFLEEVFGIPPIVFHLSFKDKISLALRFQSLILSDLKDFNTHKPDPKIEKEYGYNLRYINNVRVCAIGNELERRIEWDNLTN